jgi:hypothetical protein
MAITRLGPNQDITAAKIAGQINFKNLIINGDMSLAQRGTSSSGITGDGYFTVDRFKNEMLSAGTWTQSQSTDVPSGQGFANSVKYDCTTANASLSAGTYGFITQRFEGQNLQMLKFGTSSAETLTLSFWVKSNKTGTYIAEIITFATTKSQSQSYTISSADTWEKKTLTFTGDTATAIANSNARSLNLIFWLVAGTNNTSGTLNTSFNTTVQANRAVGQVNLADSTDNEWYITGIQLEADTSASDFEFLPYDVNLKRCRRYYFQPEFGTEHYLNTIDSTNTYRRTNIVHPNSMRASPTGTVTTSLGGGGTHSAGKPTVSGTNKDSSAVNGDLTGNVGFARIVTLTLDAEL